MRTQDELCLQWVNQYISKKTTSNSFFSNPFFSSFTFFDIGANIGGYVTVIKQRHPDANIHCFEPNVHEELKKNTRQYTNVKVNACAVSDFIGRTTIHVPDKAPALGSMIERPVFATGCADSTILHIDTPVITVDSYVKDNSIQCIDYLKVDVEGKELAVLKGASNTLGQKHVKAGQFEYGSTFQDSNITLKETVEFLNSKGYLVFEGPVEKTNELKPSTLIEDYRWENLLFVNKDLL